MNITDLLVGLNIEITNLLTSRSVEGLLKVRSYAAPVVGSLVSDFVFFVKSFRAVGGLVLVVKASQGGGESIRDSVFLVKSNCLLDGLVADSVAVSKILSHYTRARLVLLFDVMLVFVPGFLGAGGVGAGNVVDVMCGLDMNSRGSKLRVIEEQRSFRSST